MKIFILYPNQLFKNLSNFTNKKVLLIEEPLFFTQYDFHIQKLILHRVGVKFQMHFTGDFYINTLLSFTKIQE